LAPQRYKIDLQSRPPLATLEIIWGIMDLNWAIPPSPLDLTMMMMMFIIINIIICRQQAGKQVLIWEAQPSGSYSGKQLWEVTMESNCGANEKYFPENSGKSWRFLCVCIFS